MRSMLLKSCHRSAAASLMWFALVGIAPAQGLECENTHEGRVCRLPQAITAGTAVDAETQRRLGLVSVGGGCSGTLLNRFWVLTARHCVTIGSTIDGPLQPANSVLVTAAWAPDRVGLVSQIREFAVNAAPGSTPSRDIVLLYLGSADLGPVDSQRIYMIARDQGGNSRVLSGRLTTTDTVTQYGAGFSSYATGVFGTASAQPSQGLGDYRSAQFRPSKITANSYELVMNGSSQVGHGGDSGGPSVVTVNGFGVGIAGVQSTCTATGYIPGAPMPRRWTWATGISACQYVATEPFFTEILNAKRQTPDMNSMLFQRHADGRIWKYDGLAQCTAGACPGWTEIDHNPATRELVTARGALFQRHADGRVWKYAGTGQCSASACPGWVEIDRNPRTASLAGGNNGLFQLHVDKKVWKYDGVGQCRASACPGWNLIDQNPATKEIVAAHGTLFQRHADGRVWKHDSKGTCTGAACPGWTEIDHNPRTAAIAGGAEGFYQTHADGRIWKYDGSGACTAVACPGWTEIDRNLATREVVASGKALFQRHVDGRIWKYDGQGQCSATACPGWTEVDHNPATRQIVAAGGFLYQRHGDGRVWKYDGQGQCTASACPGWLEIDHNTRTSALVAVEPF